MSFEIVSVPVRILQDEKFCIIPAQSDNYLLRNKTSILDSWNGIQNSNPSFKLTLHKYLYDVFNSLSFNNLTFYYSLKKKTYVVIFETNFNLLNVKFPYEIVSGKEIYSKTNVSFFIKKLRREKILRSYEHEFLWVKSEPYAEKIEIQQYQPNCKDFYRASIIPFFKKNGINFILGTKNFLLQGITDWGGKRKKIETLELTIRREFNEEFGSFPEEIENNLPLSDSIIITTKFGKFIVIFVEIFNPEVFIKKFKRRNEIKEIIILTVDKIFEEMKIDGRMDGSFLYELREIKNMYIKKILGR